MHILLTGAGFSRNWGCWLADEVFEYLLADKQLTVPMRSQLWRDKNSGGNYEQTIQAFRDQAKHHKDPFHEKQYRDFLGILLGMFNAMKGSYGQQGFQFERTDDNRFQITHFLYAFHAIFTLNQDTLLEQRYHSEFFFGRSDTRWKDWDMPGITSKHPGTPHVFDATSLKDVAESGFSLKPQSQPYYKLHGSHNWVSKNGVVLITGGNKESDIGDVPLLDWYFAKFREAIMTPTARVMIIGYSFRDIHINKLLVEAAKKGTKFFIIDIRGIDVIDQRNSLDASTKQLWDILGQNVIGASRRLLSSTFGEDHIEHLKVMSFFQS